jgi:NADH:ubiquinone oxidoreductase subunit D
MIPGVGCKHAYMESDWREFRDMVPKLRERYLADRNARVAAILTNSEKNETDRFWLAMEEMEREARVLRQCLDGHSRSKMWLYMLTMIRAGMLRREDLKVYSEELQKEVASAFEEKKG